ncbi:hypothetical protein CASFOL_019582 [Castilleja foliolosa]|uniref:Uncharacterized protein n=1 Tax=Castilleja foliolosa TaxID=1961234 RepID=A0ABD3D4T8_9LAMI
MPPKLHFRTLPVHFSPNHFFCCLEKTNSIVKSFQRLHCCDSHHRLKLPRNNSPIRSSEDN